MDLPFLYRYAAEYFQQLELIQIIEATSTSTAAKQLAMLQQLFPQFRKWNLDCRTQVQRVILHVEDIPGELTLLF
ncbi:hypothetical protein MVEG_02429 [Podila verticillata NRRL 6337]|nr:hypothetical protein MVEG_02429 [Podila verticillata NRRL 6337]